MDEEKRKQLHKIYDLIPKIYCKGLCKENCTVIGGHKGEFDIIKEKYGIVAKCNDDLSCNFLTKEGRCSVYEDRPNICRIFGVAEGLECKYGCVREGILTQEQVMMLTLMIGNLFVLKDEAIYKSQVWNANSAQILRDQAAQAGVSEEDVEEYWKMVKALNGLADIIEANHHVQYGG